jgi:very-short-patch-repair endonuclease
MQSRRDIDAHILEIARALDSTVHARQLRAAGIDRGHVRARVSSGWMAVIVGLSYGVGPHAQDPTPDMLRRAALLHAGPAALLTGETGAEVLAGWNRGSGRCHVISSASITVSDPRFRFHRSRDRSNLLPAATSRRWPVLEPRLLCLDLARTLDPWQLAFVLCELRYRRHVVIEAFGEFIAIHAHARGMTTLRRALDLVNAGSAGTRGRTEDRARELCASAGIRTMLVNVRGALGIPNEEPDFVVVGARLNIECDGGHHLEPLQAKQDRARDMLAGDLGWRVLRIWWEDIWECPELVIATIRAALAGTMPARAFNEQRWAAGRYELGGYW